MGQKFLLTCFLFSMAVGLIAQSQSRLDIALRHIEKNQEMMKLSPSDLEGLIVNDYISNKETGATYIYLNQAHNGHKIRNAIMNFTIDKNGKVISVGNRFISDIASKASSGRSMMEPELAVVKAAEHLGVLRPEKPSNPVRAENGVLRYKPTSYVTSDILVEPVYEKSGDQYVLSWQATLDLKANADYWEIRVDASTGAFVSKNNLTVYCTHHKDKFKKHHNCGISKVMDKKAQSKSLTSVLNSTGAYRVYALPAESPNHGPHELVENPSYDAASPFGWHDTDGVEGPEYTITRGNNVFAYTDRDDDNSPDPDVVLPDGGDELRFDFVHDQTLEPIENPDAALTNLFYMNNMMHDLMFLYGFDEASGNFQQTNYSGDGAGGDYVLAQAFDGFDLATPSLNNANFSTPADGNNGRMQMFLWTAASGAVSVDEPTDLAGFYEYGTADYGTTIGALVGPITGPVELVNDGDLTSPSTGCKELENDLTGKIALIDRGLCFFSEKSYNAQTKGAVAAIICNIVGVNGGDGETTFGMAGANNAELVTIPTVSFKKSDCDKIKVALSNNVEVVVTIFERENEGPDYYDGNYDNGIIAHEFGHGISNRLTGGPSASGCLGTDEQMGEGWSDFFSLITTVEEGDMGSDPRGIGTYAVSEPVDGRGIRRFPYSTDMNINPQTFDDIKGTTAPHPLGEVWTDCLWDMYWAFVDVYGYDADWTNRSSGNGKAISLVMEGMKIQPCGPGFIEGRDAILAADILLNDGENTCLIWEVFARRGLGYFADGGDPDDRNDGTEDFEPLPTCIEGLKIKKSATGFVEPGDDIAVQLRATNHIPMTLNGVVVTDEIPEGTTFDAASSSVPGVVSGNMVSFDLGSMDYEDEVVITYNLNTSSDLKSARLDFYDFEDGGEGWTVETEEGFSTWTLSFDLYKSEETSYYIREEEAENDHSLVSPVLSISGDKPVLKFWHHFNTEAGVDGGFVQVSTDGGLTWKFTKIGDFIRNPYNTPIAYGTLAIPSLEGFTGTSNGAFIDSYLDLSAYVGQDVQVRFRYGSDENTTSGDPLGGWYIDDVELLDVLTYRGTACVSEETNSFGTCTPMVETIVNSDAGTPTKDLISSGVGFEISPNPASDYVRVFTSAEIGGSGEISLITLDGRIVYHSTIALRQEGDVHTINTLGLPSGLYIVQLKSGALQSSQKLMID